MSWRPGTLRVLLLPDADGTIEESDWELIEQDAQELHDEIADWAEQIRDEVRTERPPLPEPIKGRFREKWAPLKRVAAAAGGNWADGVDEMALHDLAEAELDREDGLINEKPAVVLLHHIHEVYRVCDLARSLRWLMRIGCRPVTSAHTGAGEPVAGVWRGGLGCHWIVASSTRVCVLAEVPPDRRR
jgi:hypothetical protein